MAHGWESKSVEAQIEEEVSPAKPYEGKPALTEEQVQDRIKKADLLLSRRRVLQQLDHTNNERYCELLRRTLVDLDAQIASLQRSSVVLTL